jgi:hypothetical protein
MILPISILAGILFLAGVIMTARGWRGARIDDHPICTRCGFDLVGLPPGVTLCSECGSDLTKPRTTRVGNRRRRRTMLTAGIMFVLLATVGLSILGTSAARQINWYHVKPVWWLKLDANDPSRASKALEELRLRLLAGRLSVSQIAGLADVGLAHQADTKQTWQPAWGTLIELAREKGKLDDARWRKYVEQAFVSPQLVVRTEVRRGEDVPTMLIFPAWRCGWQHGFEIGNDFQPSGKVIAAKSWPKSNFEFPVNGNGWASSMRASVDKNREAAASDGEQEISISGAIAIHDADAPGKPLITTRPIDVHGRWTLVPADKETVKIIRDPAAADAMRKAIRVQAMKQDAAGVCTLMVVFASSLPHPVAFEVSLRAQGREWKMSDVNAASAVHYGCAGSAPELKADHADVVLRSSLRVARETLSLTSIWDGEIVIPNVAIDRSKK